MSDWTLLYQSANRLNLFADSERPGSVLFYSKVMDLWSHINDDVTVLIFLVY